MKKYNTIIFDLDGTLTEPEVGIINSIRHALTYFDIEENDTKKLTQFIGPPLNQSFQKYYNFSAETAMKAVEYYREYFSTKGLYENYVYPGIPELLRKLKQKGCTLFVGTSKPTIFAKQILAHLNIEQYFTEIIGSNMDLTRVVKQEIITHILENHGILDDSARKQGVLMVGDTKFDIEGAKSCGVDSLAVLYGHGTQKSIEDADPNYVAQNIQNLETLLAQHT